MDTPKTNTWFYRIGQSIGSFFRAFRNLFKRKDPIIPVTASVPQESNNLDEDKSFEEYSKRISELDDIIVKLGLYKRISASHRYMYEMGRRDGSLGVVIKDFINIAKATAQETFRHIYVVVKGKLASAQAEKDTRFDIMDYDKQSHERDQAYYDYIKYQYRFFPRSYSWLLFVVYLGISLALILADMPLAFTLIHDGFNLPGSSAIGETFQELFTGNAKLILAKNWETVVTSLGIALCTIYIKIYYDEFVGTPYANKLMTFNRFVQENDLIKNIADDEAGRKNIEKEHRDKRKWKTGLAIFTLLSIIALACLRLQAASNNDEFDLNFISGAAFIAISILFPVIGGICLSHALTNLQNMSRLIRAKQNCKNSLRKYLDSVEQFTIVQKEYEDLSAANNRLGDEARMVGEYEEYLFAFYNRGYGIGSRQPDKYTIGEDFYSKVMGWRNLGVSKKINHYISKLN